MTTASFLVFPVNMMGTNCLGDAAKAIHSYGFKKALIVTDPPTVGSGVVRKVCTLLAARSVDTVVFDGVQPDPTTRNVADGLCLLQDEVCDFVISLGGSSPQDCAKGIALVAANGGTIKDYEGLDQSAKPQLPLVAINTTAGTASETTRFCIITDEARHVKMAIVDKHTMPILSVTDPELMLPEPASTTAATGMDALIHAIEAYVSTIATPITNACALKAVALISQWLRKAVADGQDFKAHEQMAYAQFLAGVAFNNASLGYVYAMAHQQHNFYDLSFGVRSALLPPHVQISNKQVATRRLSDVAHAMGEKVDGLADDAAADICLAAVYRLSTDIGLHGGLAQFQDQFKSLFCAPTEVFRKETRPVVSQEEICAIFSTFT